MNRTQESLVMYRIKYSYNTGDSFGQEDNIQQALNLTWGDLDMAKESLSRIKQHYEWYSKLHDWRSAIRWEDSIKEASSLPWHVKESEFSLYLLADGNRQFKFHAPWVGHFESLNWAEIEQFETVDNGMRIEF